jgi:hypothetical protein
LEIPLEHIDDVVQAELPSQEKEPELYQLVNDFMRHRETHLQSEYSRCNKKGRCIYGFPQPVQPYTMVDEHGRVKYRRRSEQDAWITSYIPALLKLLQCHIHVDVCFTANVVLYLYKYLYKGPDTTKFNIVQGEAIPPRSEIDDYQNARYLSSTEAAWRILRYHITTNSPSVVAIGIHLPDQQLGQMIRMASIASSVTKLMIYLHRPLAPEFDDMRLLQFYKAYRIALVPASKWPVPLLKPGDYTISITDRGALQHYQVLRRSHRVITRLKSYPPRTGELFYLRAVLQHHVGRSWKDLYTVAGVQYTSFQAAAIALGLFQRDGEAHFAMTEAIDASYSPGQLRFLFASILVDVPTDALKLYNDFLTDMSWDLQNNLPDNEWQNTLLQILQGYLRSRGASLREFQLPMPYSATSELSYEVAAFQSHSAEMAAAVEHMIGGFNPEQLAVYQQLRATVEQANNACLCFLDGKAGRGKTFLMNCLVTSLRSQGAIVLVAGSTALSIIHYDRGRTAHSTFGIPVVEVRPQSSQPTVANAY